MPPFRNPSDNSLAVGPDEIVQIVNSQFAVFSKKGARHSTTGAVLYGPAPTNTIFSGFGGVCEARNNGDAVERYDQLAGRWLIVMPIFSRIAPGEFENRGGGKVSGMAARPGRASNPGAPAAPPAKLPEAQGTYAMCYAVSVGSDPLGAYYRYAFERDLFPDYPRPAIWPDGYYTPTSTGDTVIEKHVCVADRTRMLAGQPATEQCKIIDGVNFLNNADIDGRALPPAGAPNIMVAAGGTQLHNVFEDDGIYYWKVHVDWKMPAKTSVTGPVKIPVAPYHYLCDGQLSNCVPQPGTDRRLDAQATKSCSGSCIAESAITNRLSRRIRWPRRRARAEFGGMNSGWTKIGIQRSISKAPTRRIISIAGCRASRWIRRAISARVIPSEERQIVPGRDLRRGWRMIRLAR